MILIIYIFTISFTTNLEDFLSLMAVLYLMTTGFTFYSMMI